jgi:hypothetical protein
MVATEMLNRKRKTNRRDAGKLLDQLYDFDVNGHKKALPGPNPPETEESTSMPDALSANQTAQHHGGARPRAPVRFRFP